MSVRLVLTKSQQGRILPAFLTALLPVVGVIIGASLQYYFSKSGERRKQLEGLRSQAYVDYLRSIAQIAQIGKGGDPQKRNELLAALADAKTRIYIYGVASVVKALAAFEKDSPVLNSPDSIERFYPYARR